MFIYVYLGISDDFGMLPIVITAQMHGDIAQVEASGHSKQLRGSGETRNPQWDNSNRR